MRKSIALLALALLLAAAWGRPAAEIPSLRRPAPKVVEAHPVEATTPPPFPDVTAGLRLPSTAFASPQADTRDLLRDPDPVTTPFDAVLDATRVDLDVQNWPLSAIVDELRARTGLDLRLKGDVEGVISVKVAQIGLRSLLKLLLQPRNLIHEIDGVTIWIGTRAKGY